MSLKLRVVQNLDNITITSDFSGIQLRESTFNQIIIKCHITNVTFYNVNFSVCDLRKTHFELCRFYNCTFSHCDMSTILIVDSKFHNCGLELCDMSNSIIENCVFNRLEMNDCDTSYMNFRYTQFGISRFMYFSTTNETVVVDTDTGVAYINDLRVQSSCKRIAVEKQ